MQNKLLFDVCWIRKFILMSLCLMLSIISFAQKKKTTPPAPVINQVAKIVSYEVLENGDTINKLDQNKHKQGKWLIFNEGKYGEPSLYEYGSYANNIRVGKWNVYDNDGRVVSEENFKSGIKDGEARYFDNGKLYCIGNYLALRSKYEYDTVMVEDPNTNLLRPVVIKADVGSVRHGLWTYYEPFTSKIEKVIEYQVDEVIYERDYTNTNAVDSNYKELKNKTMPHISNKPPSSVWMLEKGKKPVKYTDIPENAEYVKPNVRKSK